MMFTTVHDPGSTNQGSINKFYNLLMNLMICSCFFPVTSFPGRWYHGLRRPSTCQDCGRRTSEVFFFYGTKTSMDMGLSCFLFFIPSKMGIPYIFHSTLGTFFSLVNGWLMVITPNMIVGFDPSPYGWFMIVLPTYPVVKMCVISIIGQIMSIPEILSSTWLGHECVCNLSRLPIKVKWAKPNNQPSSPIAKKKQHIDCLIIL